MAELGSAEGDREFAEALMRRARVEGVSLVGPGGLLTGLTKTVLETALEAELTDHLGYEPHQRAGTGNTRNGTRTKTVLTEVGPVALEVPRDRDATFDPKIVRKRQRRLVGVDDLVVSLVAKGLTTGEVQAHLAEVYGSQVSRETISTITDRVLEGMVEWQNRPLDRVYPVVFIDAILVKIRDGQVANRPIYTAVGVTVDGERDILGLWAGAGGEGAKYWLQVLTEIRNRGVEDVCILVCDGLTGLPDAVTAVWPRTVVQTCVIHLLRNALPLRLPQGLAGAGEGPQTGLHRPNRGRRPRTPRGGRRAVGDPVSGDPAALGERLGGVHPVPRVRPGDPPRHLHHQRDREPERPVPPIGQGPGALPDRAVRVEAPLPDHRQPRPDRTGPPAVDQPLEGCPQRLRDRLRRTHPHQPVNPEIHRSLDSLGGGSSR